MEHNAFAGLLKMIVPAIMDIYMKEKSQPYDIAIERLYNSRLYEALENQDTWLWHLSPLLLCDLLIEELETGHINWPEEQ
jgi:hypothetical protein